ncbi:MAG: 6-phosphogluconolactonase [Aggregatilineales bacterium]
MSEVHVYPTARHLAIACAERIVSIAQSAIGVRGRFIIALAGGATPRLTYQLLATEEYSSQIDWRDSYIFFSDERCVSPESKDSNARMARETLLNFVPIPLNHIYRIHGELEPQQAAEQYEIALHDFFEQRLGLHSPQFDVVLLGLGADGHTASLFPGSPALHVRGQWVAAHEVPALKSWRITLTAEAINAAVNVLFLVSGAEKAEAVKQVLEGPHRPELLPAQLIRPETGNLYWLLDAKSAALLTPKPL